MRVLLMVDNIYIYGQLFSYDLKSDKSGPNDSCIVDLHIRQSH